MREKKEKRPAAPNEASLHEAALAYLTQRPSSVAQMRRVLTRRIASWARRVTRAGDDEAATAEIVARAETAAGAVVARLRSSGLLDDERFAAQRAGSLTRAGKSRRVVEQTLVKNGVRKELARSASSTDPDVELAAAVKHTRKKRIGAFARDRDEGGRDPKVRRRWLASLARAGYSFAVADRALRVDRDAADELLRALERT